MLEILIRNLIHKEKVKTAVFVHTIKVHGGVDTQLHSSLTWSLEGRVVSFTSLQL
jgi:hypothetical protein